MREDDGGGWRRMEEEGGRESRRGDEGGRDGGREGGCSILEKEIRACVCVCACRELCSDTTHHMGRNVHTVRVGGVQLRMARCSVCGVWCRVP